MHQWFNMPHVQRFYSLRPWTEIEVLEKLKPYILGDKPVTGFVILIDDTPIGYLQSYKVCDYPWPKQNLSQEIIDSAIGMDLFIGNNSMIGKGLGSKVIQEFIHSKVWPEFQYCIVDPDVENKAAIRCYERLKFKEHVLIETVDALERPTKLKLMMLAR